MSSTAESTSPPARATGTPHAIPLGRYFGVQLGAHWSLLAIFLLILFSLANGTLPAWHPDWSPGMRWVVALVAAILFFASVAVHELAHALVGRRHGVAIDRITLFLFGGMAEMRGSPPTPKAELLMAGAGPLTSLLIGLVATFAGLALLPEVAVGPPEAVIRAARPLPTLLLWLGPINIGLAIFNSLPGFPLDGGRVLRALLWRATGDLEKATRWAAAAGSTLGWLLVAVGLLAVFGFTVPVVGGRGSGFWFVLIGWFLHVAARASYQQVLVRQTLDDVAVASVMRTAVATVPPTMRLAQLVSEELLQHDQDAFPVVEGDQLLGIVGLEHVRRVPRAEWPVRRVAEVMVPVQQLATLTPGEPAAEALAQLGQRDQVPVVENGHLRGVVQRGDLMKLLTLRLAR